MEIVQRQAFITCVRVCVVAGLQELCPALNLLCSAVRDSHSDAQSRQFSEQLLNITMSFINTQIRKLLINTHYEAAHRNTQSTSGAVLQRPSASLSLNKNQMIFMSVMWMFYTWFRPHYKCYWSGCALSADADEGVQSSVDILDRYLTELRSYMKRFPWPAGAGAQNTNSVETAVETWEDEWEHLQTEVTQLKHDTNHQLIKLKDSMLKKCFWWHSPGRNNLSTSFLVSDFKCSLVLTCDMRRHFLTINANAYKCILNTMYYLHYWLNDYCFSWSNIHHGSASKNICNCLSAAGSGPPVHFDQSDSPGSGRPAEAKLSRTASVSSEDGGSASGVLLPSAPRPADCQHSPQ